MNPWFKHLAEVRKANPNIKDVGEIAKLAKKTYQPSGKTECVKKCIKKCNKTRKHKKQRGGDEGEETPSNDSAPASEQIESGAPQEASVVSSQPAQVGGKKSRKSRKSHKSRKH